jgi:hypothetical protein
MTHAFTVLGAALLVLSPGIATAQGTPDQGKKACVAEARRLCPMEMKSMSRKKVEGCMIQKIEQTSPTCHAAMLRIKAEREAAPPRR